jgi:hypothetical protein
LMNPATRPRPRISGACRSTVAAALLIMTSNIAAPSACGHAMTASRSIQCARVYYRITAAAISLYSLQANRQVHVLHNRHCVTTEANTLRVCSLHWISPEQLAAMYSLQFCLQQGTMIAPSQQQPRTRDSQFRRDVVALILVDNSRGLAVMLACV